MNQSIRILCMNAVYETFHFFSSLTHHYHGYFLKAPEIISGKSPQNVLFERAVLLFKLDEICAKIKGNLVIL